MYLSINISTLESNTFSLTKLHPEPGTILFLFYLIYLFYRDEFKIS